MTETQRPIYKNPWFWTVTALAAILVMAILVLVLLLAKPERPPDPEQDAPTTTTLPPPPSNVFDPEDFAYGEDGYLTCIAGESYLGVDVSKFQGSIDWPAVKEAGMTYAIIRAGGRGYGESGVLYTDTKALENYQGARAAGLQVGVYFFSQATSVAEAEEEADYLLSIIGGWQLDMPVVFDWEYMGVDSRTAFVDARTLTDCMLAFCKKIESAGYQPMLYFNPDHSTGNFIIEEVTDYPFWLAMYTDWMTYPYKVDMWQYTNTGSVPGIAGNVDINLYFPYTE